MSKQFERSDNNLVANDLSALRSEIDIIDGEMAQLFAKRMDVVSKIGELKRQAKMSVLDEAREATLKANVLKHLPDEYKKYYESVLESILSASKSYQDR